MRVAVIGAGVAGLACATEFAERGAAVEVFERATLGERAASRLAGAMLAPWCELESAEPEVARLGTGAADWWAARVPGVARQGSLVLAPPRDQGELHRFARRTAHFEWIDADGIAGLEPDLAGRFRAGLLFAEEAHLCPRCAMKALVRRLEGMGVKFHFGQNGRNPPDSFDITIDCRGLAARDVLPGLRGVRGEMLLLRSREITLSRPARLLHPRTPVYVVPRGDGLYMVGATMVERDAEGYVTARSVMELLNAAYSLHPAFGEADIVETAAGVRPAFPDNLPRVQRQGATITVNGLYRHGFLLAPAMAQQAADLIFNRRQPLERGNEADHQRRSV